MMKRITVNRWVYIAVVAAVCVGQVLVQILELVAGLQEALPGLVSFILSNQLVVQTALVMVMQTLTYPLGVVGWLSAFPLYMEGILTQGEFLVAVALVSAVAGWLQWYVVLPRLFALPKRRRSEGL
jgi:hypothetical protein